MASVFTNLFIMGIHNKIHGHMAVNKLPIQKLGPESDTISS